ncbi:hypothetical protein M9H77_23720 [Catharanthus roseus]|uniref:Uncharacterized protein n=1 Tax=Catharanthus roseus TaxID=4058 RepID=A0ACC0AWM1_CATRO|nr:hypothetical protein M9H77_23720 [Catharanthus roseus]
MVPKKSTASSSKSKKALVDDFTPYPTNLAIPLYPESLSTAARKRISEREHLKLIIKISFDAPVIEHLGLANLFGGLGWEPLLYISGTYYPELKVRVVLDRVYLSSILGILDVRNTITVDSNKKTIYEDLNWKYDATCDHLEIRPRLKDGQSDVRILEIYMIDKLQKQSPFSVAYLIHTMRNTGCDTTGTCVFRYPMILSCTGQLQIIKFTTFNNYGYAWDEANKVRIPPVEEYRLRECDTASFCSIKKITRTGIGASSSKPRK